MICWGIEFFVEFIILEEIVFGLRLRMQMVSSMIWVLFQVVETSLQILTLLFGL
jgi:hypothetical protein